MKEFKSLLSRTCINTTLITAFFYIMSWITGIHNPSISIGRFFLILLFGTLIAAVGYFIEKLRLNAYLKFFIHYSVLLTSFSVIFILAGVLNGGSSIFVGIVIFTLVYLVVRGAMALLSRKSDNKKVTAKPSGKGTGKPSAYKPIYKD